MGDYPDKIENIYCKKCGRVTEHEIYIKKKVVNERETVYGELFQYDSKNINHHYTTTKQICSECGKTKKKTTEDCCKII